MDVLQTSGTTGSERQILRSGAQLTTSDRRYNGQNLNLTTHPMLVFASVLHPGPTIVSSMFDVTFVSLGSSPSSQRRQYPCGRDRPRSHPVSDPRLTPRSAKRNGQKPSQVFRFEKRAILVAQNGSTRWQPLHRTSAPNAQPKPPMVLDSHCTVPKRSGSCIQEG